MNQLAIIKNQSIVNLDTLDASGRIRIAVAWDALSDNTKMAYQKAWKRLVDQGIVIEDLTDEGLTTCISNMHTDCLAPSTVSLTIAAVKWYFKHIMRSPVKWQVTDLRMRKIKGEGKDRGAGQVDGLDWTTVEVVCRFAESDRSVKGYRDSALIRIMSDGLLRISEAVAVNVEDIEDTTLRVQFSKTDQTGEGESLFLGDRTREMIRLYKQDAGITTGALFRRIVRGDHIQPSRLSVNGARHAIKEWAGVAGIDGFISGHSLRVGAAVSLAKAGASVVEMQEAGRWKSPQMPAHYARIQEAERGAVAKYRYGKNG